MTYNDWCAVSVIHGKRDTWFYVTFTQGLKFTQPLTAEKAADVLKGLRATTWKEDHRIFGNKESWKFNS